MFKENAEETLNGAKHGPVHHNNEVRLTIHACVSKVESLGKVEVKLDRRTLPCTACRVGDVNVDFGSIKHGFAWLLAS